MKTENDTVIIVGMIFIFVHFIDVLTPGNNSEPEISPQFVSDSPEFTLH